VQACFSGNGVLKGNHINNTANDVTHFRWDHSSLDLYYEYTRIKLQPVLDGIDILANQIDTTSKDDILEAIDTYYNIVVDALLRGSELYIRKVRNNFFKFWWSQELNDLKEKAMASCRLWKDAGKPKNGQLHDKYLRDKLAHKKRIRDERNQETSYFSNDLHEALLKKSGQEFWRSWNSKFKTKSIISQVGGIIDNTTIARNFASHFEKNLSAFQSCTERRA
jgi:hypothetical protein